MYLFCKSDYMTMVCYGGQPIEKVYFREGNEYYVKLVKDDGTYVIESDQDGYINVEPDMLELCFDTREQKINAILK